MEVPWMQPFFSFPKVWFALPMAGAQEAGPGRTQATSTDCPVSRFWG